MCSIQTGELAVLDHRSDAGVPGTAGEVTPVVALVTQKDVQPCALPISFEDLPTDLGVVRIPGHALHIEDRQRRDINQHPGRLSG